MEIKTFVCGACTTGSIGDLGLEAGPEEAMMTFLTKTICPYRGRFATSREVTFAKNDSFWVFTAGPEISGKGHSKAWVKYGTEFAAYIEKHKLGDITTLPKRINHKYHPDTDCQTWLWGPDQAACEAWYRKHMKPEVRSEKDGPSRRPKDPQHGDLCPRCRRIWGNHSVWNCPDGGIWPE